MLRARAWEPETESDKRNKRDARSEIVKVVSEKVSKIDNGGVQKNRGSGQIFLEQNRVCEETKQTEMWDQD